MKIAIDARFLGPVGTGLGKYTEKLLENLQEIDKKNHYFILLKKENYNFFQSKNKNFKRILADVPWYSPSEQIKIPQILARIKPDLVHFCHFNVPVFFTGKFVVTIHDLIKHEFSDLASTTRNPLIYFLKHRAYKVVISTAIGQSSKILVPSNWIKKRILAEFKVPENKIVVTYEAADELFGQQLIVNSKQVLKKYKIEPPFLIYVGNLYPYKNLEVVLKALKILERDPPPTGGLKFFVASARDVFHQRFAQLVKNYKLENRVIMPGFVPTSDLVVLFKLAKALVFPSLSEGFGIPGCNALVAGLPVLAADIPVFHEVYSDAVLYFDPKNEKDLAEKIKKISKDEQLRKNLISKGKNQVAKYSWQKMTSETLLVYNSL